ncbi:hypothetical protein Pelo_4332 [Pelomyxa schiedti]|nr:hypothetical protein Pelo_4332 [Pelomyxa schiedti]
MLQEVENIVAHFKEEEDNYLMYLGNMRDNFQAMSQMVTTLQQRITSLERLPEYPNSLVQKAKELQDHLKIADTQIQMTDETTMKQHKHRLDQIRDEASHKCSEMTNSVLAASGDHTILIPLEKQVQEYLVIARNILETAQCLASNQQSVAIEMDTQKNTVEGIVDEFEQLLPQLEEGANPALRFPRWAHPKPCPPQSTTCGRPNSFPQISSRIVLQNLEEEKQKALKQQEIELKEQNLKALDKQANALKVVKEKALEEQAVILHAEKQRALEKQEAEMNLKRTKIHNEKKLVQQAYTLEAANNLETVLCGFQKGVMALGELNELNLTNAVCIANGSFGSVCQVPVLPQQWGMTVPPSEVALKMMFNYTAGMRTLQQRTEFEREYEVLVMYPHWCFTNVFNHFRGETSLSLVKENLRDKFAIMDANSHQVSGCNDTRTAIPVFQRTTFMTMELAKCTLESLINSLKSPQQYQQSGPPKHGTKGTRELPSPSLPQSSIPHQQQPLCTTRDVLQLAFCVLCAVDHLNSRGWFHCDIKSDNILLMERPHIKGNIWALCDLGAAVFCRDGNPLVFPKGETFTGNGANRSPEVTQPHMIGKFPLLKNDVWAVGCVLYEAISRSHPFLQQNELNKHKICDTNLPPLVPDCSSLAPDDTNPNPRFPNNVTVAGLAGWLLEREATRRPTAREALLACGALVSLPPSLIAQFLTEIQHNASNQPQQDSTPTTHRNAATILPTASVSPPPRQSQFPAPPPSNLVPPPLAPSPQQHQHTPPPQQQPQPQQTTAAVPEELIRCMSKAVHKAHKHTVTEIFQRNGLRFGVDVVPIQSSASAATASSGSPNTMQATVSEVMRLVYCNMALRDVPDAARSLFSFLSAVSSPRYNLNLLDSCLCDV